MGYHIIEQLRGSEADPFVLLWKRLGIDYDLPVVPRDEAIPPNRIRLVAIKTVSETGDLVRSIDEDVEWPLYEPYGQAAAERYGTFPPDDVIEQHRHEDAAAVAEAIAGRLPIPAEFADTHQLEPGQYLECFITGVQRSGSDEWIVPYPAPAAPPTGSDPPFDPAAVRATVTRCDVAFDD